MDTTVLDDLTRQALEQAVRGKAVDLLSGPGGLASFLRIRRMGAPIRPEGVRGAPMQRTSPSFRGNSGLCGSSGLPWGTGISG